MKKSRAIDYTSRDFDSIKENLREFLRENYPDTQKDYSEGGFNSFVIDALSYIGDVQSFYLDYQVNEFFLDTAVDRDNIIRRGRGFGYKYNPNKSSYGRCAFYAEIPARATGNLGPDLSYAPILNAGTELVSSGGVSFTLMSDVDFSKQGNEIVVATISSTDGSPQTYAVKAYGEVVSGREERTTIEIGQFSKFRKISLPYTGITEIINVIDSEGNEYFEVPNLIQDVIWVSTGISDGEQVLKPKQVPRRFSVYHSDNSTILLFGASSNMPVSEDSIADPSITLAQKYGKNYINSKVFDPSSLITSDNLGIGPYNTTLDITYRVTEPFQLNAVPGSINEIVFPIYEFSNISSLDPSKISTVVASFEVENEEAINGDTSEETVEEMKIKVGGAYYSQDRCINEKDYEVLSYSMPSKFGSIKRVRAVRDKRRRDVVNLFVLSEDTDGALIRSSEVLKRNLKNWIMEKKHLSDKVLIKDAYIINIGIEYKFIANYSFDKFKAKQSAQDALFTRFQETAYIGESFYVSEVYDTLRRVNGLLDVLDVKITSKVGELYSDISYDIISNTSNDGREIMFPKNAIWEVKFVDSDIKGVVV